VGAAVDPFARDRFIIGDKVSVKEEIARYRELLGVDHFIMRCQWPGLPQEQVLGSIQWLGEIFASLAPGALEARAIARGNVRCTLNSTETARKFYLANGYVIDGPPDQKYGAGGYPMSKLLPLQNSWIPLKNSI
jgi:hypothetical protein